MALDEAGVRFVTEGLQGYLRDIEKANDATEDVGTKITGAATESGIAWGKIGKAAGIAATVVATAVTAIGVTMLKLAGSFDDAYDSIQVKTGATGETLEGLKTSIKNVMTSIPADGGDIAAAMGAIYQRTEATGAPLETLTAQIVELTRITGTDLNTNIESVLDATSRWGMSAEAAAPFLDELFRISQESGVPVSDLAQAITDGKAALDGFGYTAPEAATLIGALGEAGIPATDAIGGLELALKNMTKNGITDPKAELEAYIERIQNAGTDAEATGIATEIFGRQAVTMAGAIRDGTFDLDAFSAAVMANKNGITDTAEQTNDWKEKLDILKNKLLVEVEPALMAVFDAVTQGVEDAGPYVERFVQWFREDVIPIIESAVETFKRDWLPVVQRIGESLQSFWDNIGSVVFEALRDNIKNIVDVFAEAAQLIGAVIDGDWSGAFDHLKALVGETWEAIKGIIESFNEILAAAGSAVFQGIYDAADAVFGDLIRGISEWMNERVLQPILSFGQALYDAGDALIGDMVRGMAEAVGGFASLGQSIVNAIIAGIASVWSQVVQWIKDHIPSPSDLIPDWLPGGGLELTIPVTPILLTPSDWLTEWWEKELEKQDQERAREEMERIWQEWLKSHPIELSFDSLPENPLLPTTPKVPVDELTPDKVTTPTMPGEPGSKDRPSLTDISDPARFLDLVMSAIATIERLAESDIAPVSKRKLLALAKGLRAIIVEFGNAMKGIRPEAAEAAAMIATFLDPILRAVQAGAAALEALGGDGGIPGYPRIKAAIAAIHAATTVAIKELGALDTAKLERTSTTAAIVADIMHDIAAAAGDLGRTVENVRPVGTGGGGQTGSGGIPGGGTTGGAAGGGAVDRLAQILAGFTSSIPRVGQQFEGAPGGVSYIVNAVYSNPQTPGSIRIDLQELAMRASAA